MTTMAEGGETEPTDKTAAVPEDILSIIRGYADLSLTVEPQVKKPNFPSLPVTATEFEHLDKLEEEKVDNWHFDEELKFTVPVNLRDSKKAYLALLSDEPESDVDEDFLQSWGLSNLYEGPPKDSQEDAKKADA